MFLLFLPAVLPTSLQNPAGAARSKPGTTTRAIIVVITIATTTTTTKSTSMSTTRRATTNQHPVAAAAVTQIQSNLVKHTVQSQNHIASDPN